MTSLFLLMMTRDGNIDAAFARYKAAMRTMTSFEVQIAATDKRRLKLTADFVMDGKKQILFDALSTEGRYVLSITPSEYRELDWATKCYDIFPWQGPVGAVESRVSELPKAIPTWLRIGDMKAIMPGGAKLEYAGKQMLNGESCDFIRSNFNTRMGPGTVELDLAPSGLVYRYYSKTTGPNGRKEFEWVLSNYRPLQAITASRFEVRIPDGFMPFGLPDHHLPIGVGKKPSLTGWVYGAARKPWSAPRGQALLFVVTSEHSAPGKSALGALGSWRAELNAKHVVVAEASDAGSVGAAGGLLYDPDQRSVHSLDMPATPMFFLIDSGGTLRNMWMGFSHAEAGKIHDELLAAVSELK